MKNIRQLQHKPYSGKLTSQRIPIDKAARKSKGIEINEGAAWKTKKVGGHLNPKAVSNV